MVPYAVFDNLKRCLQAQLIVDPSMLVGLLGVVANVAFHHLTMVVFGMGVYGAGLALSLTGIFMLTALVTYIVIFRLGAEGCWSGICSLEIFRAWPEYMALCIPGLTGVFLEWTSIEASCFLAGLLGKAELATQVILLSAYSILFAAAFAISTGANIRVGNLLGAGDSIGARKAAMCALRLALASATLIALGLGLGREFWPRLYGASDDVMRLIVQLAPVYAAAQILDMVQFTCTGILKGMSLQRIQAIAAAIAFWVGAVPLSAYLALYRGWGVRGLWSGLAMAEAPLLMFYLYVLSSADWTQCAADARLRLQSHSDVDYDRQSELSDSDSDSGGGGSVTILIPGDAGEGLVGGEYCGGGGRASGGGGAEMMKAVGSGGFEVVFPQKARRFPLASQEKSRLLPLPQIELMV